MIIYFLFLLLVTSVTADTLDISVSNAQKTEKVGILIAIIGHQSQAREDMGALVKKALEFNGQCSVTVTFIPEIMTKQEALHQKKNGYAYIIFLEDNPSNFDWHLFEIETGSMKINKRIAKKGLLARGWAYALADSIHESLTGEPGFFSTKLAYTKQIPLKKGLHYTHIYVADYDGSNEEPLIQTRTINAHPKWNKDGKRPLLFYSENTNANMRMMASDMHKKRVVASNFEGLNMSPTFSPDGKSVVYCATRGSGSCQLYHWSHKALKKITHNDGNNFAPIFADDGKTIYFSSDFETKSPQIYAYNIENEQLQRITNDGYCVAPTYCAVRNQLAYSKMVNGIMQLFRYDIATGVHTQLTHDKAHKEECSWSACGTYLICPVENGKTSRIAFFNTITNEYRYITDVRAYCAAPAWSGVYNEYPVIS
jgi:TolB protein